MALLKAAEHSYLVKQLITEIFGLSKNHIPITCIVDSKQTHDAVNSTTVIEDKRSLVDICILRQMLERGEVKEVKWTSKYNQLADTLTKHTASAELLMNVLGGKDPLNYD